MHQIFLFVILSLHSTLTSGLYPRKPRKANTQVHNQWEIGDLIVKRWENATAPLLLAAKFSLYRSYLNDCGDASWSILWPLTERKCNNWIIPDTPVECSGGIRGGTSFDAVPRIPSSRAGWLTCDKNSRVPEAEQKMSQEQKKWLKWRIFDVEERNMNATWHAPPQFIAAKLEVINGIPLKEPNSTSAQVKVFSILYDIKDKLLCYSYSGGDSPTSLLYECGFNPIDVTECTKGFDACNPYVNVTETLESMEEWERRFV